VELEGLYSRDGVRILRDGEREPKEMFVLFVFVSSKFVEYVENKRTTGDSQSSSPAKTTGIAAKMLVKATPKMYFIFAVWGRMERKQKGLGIRAAGQSRPIVNAVVDADEKR
jgi:hypothetical protein